MINIGTPAAGIDKPLDHLMACHRRIEQRLDTLVGAAAHIEQNREPALQAIRNSLQFMDTSGALHTRDEESSLFPRLRPKLSASESAFIDSLETQHTQADAIYSELKHLVSELESSAVTSPALIGRYRDCAERLRSLYRDHIRVEDNNLAPLARRDLNQSEISQIAAEMRARRS